MDITSEAFWFLEMGDTLTVEHKETLSQYRLKGDYTIFLRNLHFFFLYLS